MSSTLPDYRPRVEVALHITVMQAYHLAWNSARKQLEQTMNESPLALVTGAARGIGAAIAVELARNGMDTAIFDIIEADEVSASIQAAGQSALAVTGDVTDAEDRLRAINAIEQRFGRLDVLVNNAGVAPNVRADILDTTAESFDRVMNINLKGPYFLTQTAAAWMIRQRETRGDDWMCVVNISSCSACVYRKLDSVENGPESVGVVSSVHAAGRS